MTNNHTVEKIGGTSMSQFGEVLDNILIGNRSEAELYNRIIVVSAYGGITNELLEHKKTSKSGVYSLFSKDDDSWAWGDAITKVGQTMCSINKSFESLGLDITKKRIRYLAKDTNANTITHYLAAPLARIKKLTNTITEAFPTADIMLKKVALVSAIGTNMADTWVLPTAVHALANAGVEILGLHKCMRQVDIQFVVEEDDFQKAVCALHKALIEESRPS